MSKKFIFVLVGVIFFFGFKLASASVIINEIELNPTSERFIELYNSDSSSVDLTGWYIQRKTQTGSDFGSLVSKTNFENKTIGANDYFLISRNSIENADIVLSSLTLTESNTIQIKNSAGEVVDKVGYGDCDGSLAPNPTEGQSIQKNNSGSWIAGSPTPGASNEVSSGGDDSDIGNDNTDDTNNTDNADNSNNTENNNTDTNTGTNSSHGTSTTTKAKAIKNPTIKAKILANNLAFVGQPLEFKSSVLGYSNENIVLGKIFWNFGDGSSFQQINNFEKFNHIYLYPGEYSVSMEYYSSYLSDIPDAVNKIVIKVVPVTVSISKVGDAKDFFIELTNNSDYEIDISKWMINANGKMFVFPKNSVIMSKKAITISGKITGFVLGDEKNLKLISSTGETVFDYNSLFTQDEIIAKTPIKSSVNTPPVEPVHNAPQSDISGDKSENLADDQTPDKMSDKTPNQTQVSDDNLSATAVLGDTQIKGTNNYLFFGIFGILLAGVGIGVYLIRRNRIPTNTEDGNDFKILDE